MAGCQSTITFITHHILKNHHYAKKCRKNRSNHSHRYRSCSSLSRLERNRYRMAQLGRRNSSCHYARYGIYQILPTIQNHRRRHMQVLTYLKSKIMSPWGLMRGLRLFMGLAILFQAYLSGQYALMILGIGFIALPLLNLGCGCDGNSCNI